MSRVIEGMSPVQSKAWLSLVSTGQLLPAALDQQLSDDAGIINFEYAILSALALAKGQTMRSGDLAEALGSPAPRMSKAISRLESRGLVLRATCPTDGRAVNVTLTEEGERVFRAASVPHVRFAKDTVLSGLSDTQLEQLTGLLHLILGNLDPDANFDRTFG